MQSETQKMSNQQGTQNAARDTAKRKAKKESTGPEFTGADHTAPNLDASAMKNNHLTKNDQGEIELDKAAEVPKKSGNPQQ